MVWNGRIDHCRDDDLVRYFGGDSGWERRVRVRWNGEGRHFDGMLREIQRSIRIQSFGGCTILLLGRMLVKICVVMVVLVMMVVVGCFQQCHFVCAPLFVFWLFGWIGDEDELMDVYL